MWQNEQQQGNIQAGIQITQEREFDGYETINQILITPVNNFFNLFGDEKFQAQNESNLPLSNSLKKNYKDQKQTPSVKSSQGFFSYQKESFINREEFLEEGTIPAQYIKKIAYSFNQQSASKEVEDEHVCEKCLWMRQSISGFKGRCSHRESKCAQRVKELEEELNKLSTQRKELLNQQNKLEKLQPKDISDYTPVEDMELSLMVKILESDKQQALKEVRFACERVKELEGKLKEKQEVIDNMNQKHHVNQIDKETSQILLTAKSSLEKLIKQQQQSQQREQMEKYLEQIGVQIQALFSTKESEHQKVAVLTKQVLSLESQIQQFQNEIIEHQQLLHIQNKSDELSKNQIADLITLTQQQLEQIQKLEEINLDQENELNTLRQQIRSTREDFTRISTEVLLQGREFKQRQMETDVQNYKLKIKSVEAETTRLEAHYQDTIKGLQEELQKTRNQYIQIKQENETYLIQIQQNKLTQQNYEKQIQQIKSLPSHNYSNSKSYRMPSGEIGVQTDDFKPFKQVTIEESIGQKVSQPNFMFDNSDLSMVSEVSIIKGSISQNDQYIQTEQDFIGNEEEQFSNAEIMAAIKQLSMIILSKRDQLDERTREVVEKTFGKHFSSVISTYETKIKELETSYSELKTTMRQESDNYLMALQKVKKLTDYLIKIKVALASGDDYQIKTILSQLKQQENELIKQGNNSQQEFEHLKSEIDSRRRASVAQDVQHNQSALYRNLGQEGGKLKQLLGENAQLRMQVIELEEKSQQIQKLESKIKQLQTDKRKQVKKKQESIVGENQFEFQQDFLVSFYLVLFRMHGQYG